MITSHDMTKHNNHFSSGLETGLGLGSSEFGVMKYIMDVYYIVQHMM
jgi:hypothetical protein